jgi:hypothetical protein
LGRTSWGTPFRLGLHKLPRAVTIAKVFGQVEGTALQKAPCGPGHVRLLGDDPRSGRPRWPVKRPNLTIGSDPPFWGSTGAELPAPNLPRQAPGLACPRVHNMTSSPRNLTPGTLAQAAIAALFAARAIARTRRPSRAARRGSSAAWRRRGSGSGTGAAFSFDPNNNIIDYFCPVDVHGSIALSAPGYAHDAGRSRRASRLLNVGCPISQQCVEFHAALAPGPNTVEPDRGAALHRASIRFFCPRTRISPAIARVRVLHDTGGTDRRRHRHHVPGSYGSR